jgi:multidrug efflux pump
MRSVSVNILTMLALVLSIGVVVDTPSLSSKASIAIEAGMKPMQAAFGMEEIAFAVIAITISLIAVFTLAFQKSHGPPLRQFAVAVAGSVAVSAFVALTLTR